ncbi:MAG: cryptochrome/photolyase family protein [Steroidobacteraceae bacterium]
MPTEGVRAPSPDPALVWFRRDLRDFDHAALCAALAMHASVHCVFVFDTEILHALKSRTDRRVTFIWNCVRELRESLEARGSALHVLHGRARVEIPRLANRLGVSAVYANRDYEPQAMRRDETVAKRLKAGGIEWRTCKDQVIFELGEIRTRKGTAFSVFTPYKRAWLARLAAEPIATHNLDRLSRRLARAKSEALPSLGDIGFESTDLPVPAGMSGAAHALKAFGKRIENYAKSRDFPARSATSGLSVHLRFGTVSIRTLVLMARRHKGPGAEAWLSELIWREFYFAILAWRPDVVDEPFRREFSALHWDYSADHWRAWCAGRTGYPIVDAAMRELNTSGRMHNRLRMITASFLVKDLGIDWRFGERYFSHRLLDYDMAANNGGWQWCASTGCDAQPWFRILNPVTQSQRFDRSGRYIRSHVPELSRVRDPFIHAPWTMSAAEQMARCCLIGRDYPEPIVTHAQARVRTLARYARARAAPRRDSM